MSNDTSWTSPSNTGYNLVFIYVTWIVQMVLIGGGNAIIAFAIIRYKALRTRKEYIIIFGLSLADALNLLSYGTAGIRRLHLIVTKDFNTMSTVWHCTTIPPNLIWLGSDTTAACMLVIVSLDRLLAVSIPMKYMLFRASYAIALVSSTYCLCWGNVILGVVLAWKNEHLETLVPAACFTGGTWLGIDELYGSLTMYAVPVLGALSILIYIGVGVVFYNKTSSVTPSVKEDKKRKKERERQRRLTITLGFSCICTLLFTTIPFTIAYSDDFGLISLTRLTNQIMWLMPNLNPFCNVVIYFKRQADIVRGIRSMVMCRSMPGNVTLWKTTSASGGKSVHESESAK